jgi:DNA repair exonuclease SbcCD nuclease subunit
MTRLDVELQKLGLPCFTITGNHDYSNPTWLETLFPGRTHSGIIPVDGKRVDFHGVKIAGVPPYKATAYREKLAEIERLVDGADVILYHGPVDGVLDIPMMHANPLHIGEIAVDKATKAVLLGDIHVQGYHFRSSPTQGRTVLVGYPGSTEMCSKSESVEKSMPLIRVTEQAAEVERTIPLQTRRHISRTIRTTADLDWLVAELKALADENPVVLVEFDRSVTDTVSRIHAVLDAQRCVIRCYPLPPDKTATTRVVSDDPEEQLGIDHFVCRRFENRPDLATFAMTLLACGDTDANNVVSNFVEERLEAADLRE